MYRGLLGTLSLWFVGAVVLRAVVIPGQTCPPITADSAMAAARESAAWMARVQRADGSYLYEFDTSTGKESAEYNAVRHAGVTMSLYLLARSGDVSALKTGDRALAWMEAHLYRYGGWAAIEDPYDGAIELGAAALMLAGLAQRRLVAGDERYDTLMHEVARFIVGMQRPDGSFLLAWVKPAGAPDPYQTSVYATGEAFWALTLMHEAFPGDGWDRPARAVADYISLRRDTVEKQKYPPWADQWAAYGLAEMADWPLNDGNVRYARSLAERFGFLIRVESQREGGRISEVLRGPRARAAGMGTWVEGLTSLWRLAGSDQRMGDLRAKIAERAVCGAGMLVERQVSAQAARGETRPELVRGAWFTNEVTRMDDQQHALSGILRAVPIIAGEAGR